MYLVRCMLYVVCMLFVFWCLLFVDLLSSSNLANNLPVSEPWEEAFVADCSGWGHVEFLQLNRDGMATCVESMRSMVGRWGDYFGYIYIYTYNTYEPFFDDLQMIKYLQNVASDHGDDAFAGSCWFTNLFVSTTFFICLAPQKIANEQLGAEAILNPTKINRTASASNSLWKNASQN